MPIKSAKFGGTCTWQTSLALYCGTRLFTWALCAHENSEGKVRALYYLSCILVGADLNYSLIEKMCLALTFAIQKLRHYIQGHTAYIICKAGYYLRAVV